MPGNVVRINNSDKLEWYVGDSKMEGLIKFLNKVGFKQHPIDRVGGHTPEDYTIKMPPKHKEQRRRR